MGYMYTCNNASSVVTYIVQEPSYKILYLLDELFIVYCKLHMRGHAFARVEIYMRWLEVLLHMFMDFFRDGLHYYEI